MAGLPLGALTTALGSVLLDAGTLAVELVVFGTGKLLRGLGAVHAAADRGAGEAQTRAGADKSALGKHCGGGGQDGVERVTIGGGGRSGRDGSRIGLTKARSSLELDCIR